MSEPQQKRRRGCLFYVVIVAAIVLLGGYLGLLFARKFVDQLTDAQPMPVPTVQMPEAQLFQLRDRVDTFREAVRDGETVAPLELSADALNALIESDPAFAPIKGRIYVSGLQDGQVQAQVSFPAEELGMDSLRGRYVNANGVFNVGLANEELRVMAESLSTKGKPFPMYVMRKIAVQNLAQKINEDAKASMGIKKLQSVEVKGGKLVITPKH